MKRIALVMPVFNNLEFTKKCITTLEPKITHKDLKFCEFSMVVIDDGSTDGTGHWLRENHPQVTVLEGDGNLWWSGGVNMGAEYALREMKSDFILLWNNDVIPSDEYFREMDRLVGEMPDNVVAGSKIFESGEKRRIWACGGVFNSRTGAIYMIGTGKPDSDEFRKPISVDWLPGMGTLIPAKVIEKIGYWDAESFPQYHGDSDFTYRAKKAEFDLVVYPELVLSNDKTTSGLKHEGTLKGLYLALTSIRSNTRIKTSFRFYQKHATSVLAYRTLFKSYFRMFGGFVKWKVASLFGIKKRGNDRS
jgi:GT2 family glycosyltransferase